MIRWLGHLILVCLLGISALQAYDINSTIVEGNTTLYQNLLQQLYHDKNITADKVLEKSLLEILISDDKKLASKVDIKIPTPKESEAYKKLFLDYLKNIRHIAKTKKLLATNITKIETIKEEIDKLHNDEDKLLTLELQDALYHRNIKLYKKQIALDKTEIIKIQTLLLNSLEHIKIDNKTIKTEITKNSTQQKQITNQINSLQIDQEQAVLVDDTQSITVLKSVLSKLQIQKQNILQELVALRFLLFSEALQRKDKVAFSIQKELLKDTQKSQFYSLENEEYLNKLFYAMETQYIGRFHTLAGSSEEEIKMLKNKAWDVIFNPIFHINQTPVSIFKLIMTLFIFVMGFIIGAMYKRKIKNMTLNRRSFTTSTRTLLANMGNYLIIIIAFFIALNVLGVKLSSFAVVAGALSVGIGFGLQNVVSNFVSGLILMIERSIKIGDYIQVDDKLRGYVTDIRMRSTTVITNENIDVIIPNQKLIESNVVNWTMGDNIRRFSIPFGVAYGTDAHRVIELVTKAVLESEYREDIVDNKQRTTSVIMTGMGDSSVNFELFVWVKGDYLHKPKRTASIFLLLIYDTLNNNGIEIPFPQQDIHIRSVKDVFTIKEEEGRDEKK